MHELTPNLDKEKALPLYIQLTEYIKQEIVKGNIPLNEKLPSKRKLAQYLKVSFNTVQSAYDQLCAEGFIESMPRKGFFVCLDVEEYLLEDNSEVLAVPTPENDSLQIKLDFSSGKVDMENFPHSLWKKLSIKSLLHSQNEWFYNGEPQGDIPLREEIVKNLYSTRGGSCAKDQIVIGAGTQHLMALICLLIGKDKKFAFENPGFHRTRITVEDLGARTVPIPLDHQGIIVSDLYKSDANAVYVTPSHQFPYGMIMPISRRLELLEWADKQNGYIIEDDYDGEFRYKGKPIPALQGLDKKHRVIYLGTFSKSLIPSLRISYAVLPSSLVKKYKQHFTIYKQTVSRLHQDTLTRFMQEGYWNSHLNKMRTLYRKKHQTLLQSIETYFGEKVKVIGENSGLHIVLEIDCDRSECSLVQDALTVGVKVYPVSIYYFSNEYEGNPKLLLGYGGLSEQEIEQGIKLLKEAWRLDK